MLIMKVQSAVTTYVELSWLRVSHMQWYQEQVSKLHSFMAQMHGPLHTFMKHARNNVMRAGAKKYYFKSTCCVQKQHIPWLLVFRVPWKIRSLHCNVNQLITRHTVGWLVCECVWGACNKSFSVPPFILRCKLILSGIPAVHAGSTATSWGMVKLAHNYGDDGWLLKSWQESSAQKDSKYTTMFFSPWRKRSVCKHK